MVNTLKSFLDRLIPPVFAERPAGIQSWFFDYFRELEAAEGRKRYARALAADLRLAEFQPAGRVVVDAGSGFGVTLLGLGSLGAARAIGLEAFRPMAVSSRRLAARSALEGDVLIVRASVDQVPLPDRSVDFIYCNEAISHFLHPGGFLRESARILKPGGKLMICDGNNAANPRTVSRVREIWRRFEEGPPGDDIHGHRVEVPYRERRRAMIAATFPGLEEERLDRLAWGTFGLHGTAILDRAREMIEAGRFPGAPTVVDRSPVDPAKGDFIENLVDARGLSPELNDLGFSVRVHAHFGGARSPVLAGVNRVLRALTAVTLPYARSVKIVATRRPPPGDVSTNA